MSKIKDNIVVKSHDVNIDKEYAQWIAELKVRYRSAQAKAAVRINAEQLVFNWELGRDLVLKKAEQRWGAGVVEQVSLDLQAAFPESKGFSTTNLWYMKQWYLFYSETAEKLQQAVRELPKQKLPQVGGEIQPAENKKKYKTPPAGGEMSGEYALLPHPAQLLCGSRTKDRPIPTRVCW